MKLIYIAGPYTKGDTAVNVRKAIDAGEEVARKGHTPYIPHLTHFWHLVHPHEINFWYFHDSQWLAKCDALLRLPGESHGADMEVELARAQGLEIYTSLEDIPEET